MSESVGSVLVFSGRPDPTWRIENETTRRLEAIWDEFEPCAEKQISTSQLGYRGCSLARAPGIEYTCYGGVVTRKSGDEIESRRDKARIFEKSLLATAPKGLFPDEIIDPELR